jgi:adenylate kinase
VADAAESGRVAHRLVMLGAPGCGKGTQAAILAQRLGVPAISTGEMLRAAVAAGSPLGTRVRDIMAAGALVDDGLMANVVRERLVGADCARGFILDGYPRTVAQARTLESLLAQAGSSLDAVLMLDVPEDVLVARATGRGRADDEEDVVRERLRVYHEKTEPLVAYYESAGLLRDVDGHRALETVTAGILRVLGVGS